MLKIAGCVFRYHLFVCIGLYCAFFSKAFAFDKPSDNKLDEIAYQQVSPDIFVFKVSLPKAYGEISTNNHKNKVTLFIKDTILAKKWRYSMKVDDNEWVESIKGEQHATQTVFVLTFKNRVKVKYEIQDRTLIVSFMPIDQKDNVNANLLFDHNKPITLDLQKISVRAALQVLADFAKFNLVTSDNVTGSINLKLNHVPWQEVLDIILIAKNLGKRKIGNTLYIAPATIIAAQEQEALAALTATEATEPLTTEFLRLNYADVRDLYKVLTTQQKDILSPRGNLSYDPRTNTLIVEDIKSYIDKINTMVRKLDIPTKQVLIEAKIVQISRSVISELGINYSNTANFSADDKIKGRTSIAINPNYVTPRNPPIDGSSTLGISFARLPGSISLNMELLALESEGEAKQVSNPHLVVSDNEEAYISQGQEIPYLESTSSGAASLAFKDAVLELRVTPQIAPNNHLVMTILVKKDQATNNNTAGGAPILSKREIKTRLLMKNNETIALGGIYEKEMSQRKSKVPLLGDLPFVGWLFSSRSNNVINRELLIFLTPRIV